jgi:hypothetical protein
MIQFHETALKDLILHRIGRKSSEEEIVYSKDLLQIDKNLEEVLLKYFLLSFRSEEYFNFYHESDIALNEVFVYVSRIFSEPGSLSEQSLSIARHLYEKSNHPRIKGGELYVVYFTDCLVNGERTDAIGLFKSENKDTFLKISHSSDNFEIESDNGVNINKLDKGCLIFNIEKEKGYFVSIVDNTNKGIEAQYWIDEFLHIRQREDEFFNTQNLLTLCKNFVTNELPQKFDVTKADQIDFLNKSVGYFRKNENFDMNEFSQEVIGQSEIIDDFHKFKAEFQKVRDIDLSDNFIISESAVKKQARVFKSVIKLDKNFHIYVHGNRELIEQGIDESGRKFYKIYYKEES